MPGRLTLRVVKGPIQGHIFRFDEHDTFIFGRAHDCHARLPEKDSTASRHHFILEVNPPDACVRDLGSLNGTLVNGKKYGGRSKRETPEQAARRLFPTVDLRDGDEIRVGETVFSFHVHVAAACCECGRQIEDRQRAFCEWKTGTYICPECREKTLKPGGPANIPAPVRCERCGNDVSSEVGQARVASYICRACRASAEADPGGLLRDLLQKQGSGDADPAHARIARFEIGRMLGKGGMGAVYLARQKDDGSTAALKVMLSKSIVNEHSRQVFLREIETTRRLKHKNIVEFQDAGAVGSLFYLLIEYCDGGSVADLMARRGGQLPLAEAAMIMLDSLEGLAFAHAQEFVHRDLKPQNILLSGSEPNWNAKIADMGLAKNFSKAGHSGMTATGSYAGSHPFMPCEQLTNFKFVRPVSDVWSIGATFYKMLTRQAPRNLRQGQDPIDAILNGRIVPIREREPDIPPRVAEVIDRSLSKEVAERYQYASEMRRALEQAL